MDRKVNVRSIDGAALKGVDARDNETLKPGAKDSIPAVDNELTPFSGSQGCESLAGKTGGLNSNR
jgi:hypothetical protein